LGVSLVVHAWEFAKTYFIRHIRGMTKRIAIIGGGAAGFFAAINVAQRNSDWQVFIFEKSKQVLGKVKVSGGGRCNVTHACFEPKELVKFYPRGHKELLGPFHLFQPGDMFDWLEQRGVALKTEDDNRVFPSTDSSQTIIDCFIKEANEAGVKLYTGKGLRDFNKVGDKWSIDFTDGSTEEYDAIIITTGSSTQLYDLIQSKGHEIMKPVPSLFTFNIKDERIDGLAGVVAAQCEVKIEGTKFEEFGPVLITHWGMSGPGILKLSARAARDLASVDYNFNIRINWDTRFSKESILDYLKEWKQDHSKQLVKAYSPIKVPQRLWQSLLIKEGRLSETKWADVSNKQMEKIAEACCFSFFNVKGKSTFKEEFVTAGGVSLKEVDFRTMQSKVLPGIYFAGEVLDIDAVTGGFNFQAAWTTAFIASQSV
jgi:predicted Rossmann fold flavoprotein